MGLAADRVSGQPCDGVSTSPGAKAATCTLVPLRVNEGIESLHSAARYLEKQLPGVLSGSFSIEVFCHFPAIFASFSLVFPTDLLKFLILGKMAAKCPCSRFQSRFGLIFPREFLEL